MQKFTHLILLITLFSSCGVNKTESRLEVKPLSLEEKMLDLEVAFNHFRQYYAPLRYKERTLNLDYEVVFEQLREEAKTSTTDHEFHKILGRLANSFKDGHVSVNIPRKDIYSLPFYTDYLDGQYIVVFVNKEFSANTGISVGDQLLKMNGKPVSEIATEILNYHSFGYDRADARNAAFNLTYRRFLKPESMQIFLDFKRDSDGAEFNIMTFWNKKSGNVAGTPDNSQMVSEASNAGILQFGQNVSFFYTNKTKSAFNFLKVKVSKEQWQQAGQEGEPFDVFALLYRHQEKNILLVRIPTYSIDPENLKKNLKTYEILLKSYSNLADVLVIDQTHNPGGSVEYVEELARLFLKKPGPSFGFAPRADRLWLETINGIASGPELSQQEKKYFKNLYQEIDNANERGDFLAPQIALTRTTTTIVDNTAWNKPILLLIDELCGSGGDGFPMILKGNQAAILFGHRTAGMGGNVESVPQLPNSGAQFRLTRSLFYLATPDGSLPEKAIIENNGVEPHIKRDYGYADFKDGFSGYVKDFSDAAVGLL